MKNGIKIMSLEGADILRHNVEGKYIKHTYDAVFSNSKLKYKLEKGKKENKLNVRNDATRDIINLEFNMPVTNIDKDKYKKYEKYISTDLKKGTNKISANNIRKILYTDGFILEFDKEKTLKGNKKDGTKVINKDGYYILVDRNKKELAREKIEKESIKYREWFRSSAKARIGEILYISETLYDKIAKWQMMGIELPEDEECMLVEMMAYMALTSSTIEEEIEINPENILVLNDLKSRRFTNCAKVVVDEETGECKVVREKDYVENTLFDGQALIEDSFFIDSEAGMKLLRHHFFKACGFRSYIQEFMKDHCKKNGLDYNEYSVKDKYGNDVKVKDIMVITTDNATKFEKFFDDKAKGFKQWKAAVNKDNNLFGVCKEDHESKFGTRQRMSYQMLNTLPVSKEELKEISKYSIDYINAMKEDNEAFLTHLDNNKNITNPYEMMVELAKTNKDFTKTKLFKEFKAETLCELKKKLRKGKIMTEGDNLTVCGNPYLMLLHAVGKVELDEEGYVITEDETLPTSEEHISVYTKRFDDKEDLVAFRNPHNAPNNIALFKNYKNDLMDKYFNFSKNIVAVNLVNTELQDLANGLDQDSDFMFTTNDKNIVKVVKEKVFRKEKYPVIVNKIEKSKKKYTNTQINKAIIDNILAKGKNDIGTSSNQAQIAMSLFADSGYKNEELLDNVIILSVLAQVAIDNSKRKFEVELDKEIERLSSKAKRPLFFYYTSKNKETEYKVLGIDGKVKRKFKNKYEAQLYAEKIVEQSELNFKDESEKEMYINLLIKTKKSKKKETAYDKDIKCTMNYLQEIIGEDVKNESKKKGEKIETETLLIKVKGKPVYDQCEKIKALVEEYDKVVKEFNVKISDMSDAERYEKKVEFKHQQEYLAEEIINKIKKMSITEKTINTLIRSALSKDVKNSNTHVRLKLLNVLFQSKRDDFLSQFTTQVKDNCIKFKYINSFKSITKKMIQE